MLEKAITNSILKYLNALPMCMAEKNHGSNATGKGRSDISGCWKGRAFRIEVKSPDHNNQPTEAQKLNIERWERAGALCFVAYSLEDVKKYIF